MNNVVSLDNHRTIHKLQQTPNADLFFPVQEMPLAAINGETRIEIPDKKAILRMDTGNVLGIHGQGYNLVKNEDVYPRFEEALKQSSIDLSGMKVKDHISYEGARSVRCYTFPAHEVNLTPAVGDKVSMELKVMNSYDGSTAFMSHVGGNRLICTNGMVAFDKFMQSYGKHTARLDIGRVISQVNQALDIYIDQTQYWHKWVNKRVTETDVQAVIHAMPNYTESLEEKLLNLYRDEIQETGQTVWSLFNALTYWSTHEDIKKTSQGNAISIQLGREDKVRKTIQSTTFRALAA